MLKPITKEAYRLFHDGSLAFAQMEANGLRIDVDYLTKTITRMEKKIVSLEEVMKQDQVYKSWKKEYGSKTNMGSDEQLAHIVYDVLGFECKQFTEKSKKRSVDKNALARIDHPFVQNRLKLEKDKHAVTTYLKGILKETVDGYLHPSFNLHTVRTFRSSSSDPNAQNMPIRDPEYGEMIRRCFIARNGHVFGEGDLKGIEVSISCCYHKDPNLIKYVKDPTTDMHRDTAMELFMLDKEQVNKRTTRDSAKNQFVFPEFYGSMYFQCAPAIWEAMETRNFCVGESGISIREHLKSKGIKKLGDCDPKGTPKKGTFVYHVKEVQDSFWKRRFRVYSNWKEQRWQEYRRDGGFNYLTGFRSEGIFSRNDVSNHPVQGAAFHVDLLAIILLQRWLNKHKMKSLIVGEIHDSLLLDLHEKEMDDVLVKLLHIIEVEIPKKWQWVNVPLRAEIEVSPRGGSWWSKAPYHI